MGTKLSKADKDIISGIVTKLNLTLDWQKNSEQIAGILKEQVPEAQLAVYWTQSGEAVYFTSYARPIFEEYIQSLTRANISQSQSLTPLDGLEHAYSQALKINGQFLGILLLNLINEDDLGNTELVLNTLKQQLVLARYASEMAEEVEKRTSTDKSTGLWKRTYFNERFREETERLSRSKEIGSVAIMGLDDLGAMVRMMRPEEHNSLLSTIGNTLKSLLRQTDWVVRWDNYDILFYFPNTSPESALEVFGRCMNALVQKNPILQGVVGLCSTSETNSARGLIQLAARRLDLARKDGRRKLICFATRASGLKFWEYGEGDDD